MARLNSKRIVERWNASGGEGRLNASPLITLARIGRLDSQHKLYDLIHISTEVYDEVVIAGDGMPGAAAVSKADWIRVSPVHDVEGLAKLLATKSGLGAGEISAIFLAKELSADLTLMDEWKGRMLAIEKGLTVVGCIGILEELFRRGEIPDLRQVYGELLRQKIRVDLRTLQTSLQQFGLTILQARFSATAFASFQMGAESLRMALIQGMENANKTRVHVEGLANGGFLEG
jgi:uncharacterized protein